MDQDGFFYAIDQLKDPLTRVFEHLWLLNTCVVYAQSICIARALHSASWLKVANIDE